MWPTVEYVLMTDANFKNAGYALMIEEKNADEKLTSLKKTYAPVAFSSKTFSPSQIKMSIYARVRGHIICIYGVQPHSLGIDKAGNCTDGQQVCDNFTIAHVPGRMNTAADFRSRLYLHPKDQVQLLIREDIQTSPIEVHIQSSNITEEKQFCFLRDRRRNLGEKTQSKEKESRKRHHPNSRRRPKYQVNQRRKQYNLISKRNYQKKIRRRTAT